MQTHLYRRGAIYYWRRLVPTAFQPILGARDLRASLQTNIPETARSLARQIDAAFDLALEELEQIVRSGQVLSDAVKSRFVRELRQEIIETADANRLMGGRRTSDKIEAAVAIALNRQMTTESLIKTNDLEQGKIHADRLLAAEGVRLDTNGLEYHQLARDLLRSMADAFGIVAGHEEGLGPELDSSLLRDAPAKVTSDGIRTADQVRDDEANMRELFSVHAKALVASKRASQDWSTGHVDDAEKSFELWNKIVGDKSIAQYEKANAVFFVTQLSRMPVGVGQRHPYKEILATEAIAKADESRLSRSSRPRSESS
jgi:Domain of unknown function (DUF6538)